MGIVNLEHCQCMALSFMNIMNHQLSQSVILSVQSKSNELLMKTDNPEQFQSGTLSVMNIINMDDFTVRCLFIDISNIATLKAKNILLRLILNYKQIYSSVM